MKKLLTILILLLTVASQGWAEEGTTFTLHPHAVGSWNALQISGDDLNGFAEDDVIKVYVQDVGTNATCCLQDASWSEIESVSTLTDDSYYSFTGTSGKYSRIAGGIKVTGHNYTITKVEWISNSEVKKTLYDRDFRIQTNWGQYKQFQKNEEYFDFLSSEGDKDKFIYTVKDLVSPNITLQDGEWNNISGVGPISLSELPGDNATLSITSDDVANVLKDKGLIIKGQAYTLTKVTLKNGDSEATEIYPETSPEVVMGTDWSHYAQIDKTKFSGVTANSTLTFYVKDIVKDKKMIFQYVNGNSWADVSGSEITLTGDGNVEQTITSGFYSNIKTGGWIIKGLNYTLTDVKLITAKTETVLNENPTEIKAQTQETAETSVSIEGTAFDKASVGDIIKLYISETSDGANVELKEKGGSWSQISESSYIKDKSTYKVTLTEDNIKALQEHGLYIGGDKFKCDKVTLISAATGSVIVDKYFDTNGKADLSKLSAQSNNVSLNYDSTAKTAKITSTSGWTGVALSPFRTETVSGKELAITLSKGIQIKVAVDFSDGTSRMSIMDPDATSTETTYYFPLDGDKNISSIQIQPTAEQTEELTISNIQVNAAQTNPVFSDSKADLKKFVAISNDEYSFKSSTSDAYYKYTQKGETAEGAVLEIPASEDVKGENKQVKITFAEAKQAMVLYTISGSEQKSINMSEAATEVTIPLDVTNALTQIIIKGTGQNQEINISEIAIETSIDYGTLLTKDNNNNDVTYPYALNENDWDKYVTFNKSYFSNAKAGDVITVLVSNIKSGAKYLLQTNHESFTDNEGAAKDLTNETILQYTLTNSSALLLRDIELMVKGQGYTIEKVYLKSLGTEEPTISDISLDKFEKLDWKNSLYLYAGSTISAKNKKLVVKTSTGTKLKVAVYLKDGDTKTEEVVSDGTAKTDYSVSLGSEDKKIEKIIITNNGDSGIEYSSISLEDEAAAEDNRVERILTSEGKTVEFWSGGPSFDAYLFKNVVVGDIIKVTVSALSGSDGHQIALQNKNGENGEKFGSAKDITEIGVVEFALGENAVNELKENGLYVTGKYYTYTKIALWSESELGTETASTYTLTTAVTPTGSGTIEVKKAGTVTTDTEFAANTELTLTAKANSGYTFSKWTDGTNDLTANEDKTLTVTMDANKSIIAVFEAEVSKLTELESRTLYENLTTTDYLSWNEILSLGSNWGAVLEKGEEIQVTVSAKNSATEWPKVVLRDASSKGVGNDIIVKDITEFPYVATFTLTADNVTALTSGFKIAGDGVTITKIVLHKPAAVTPVFNSEGKADLSKMGVTNSMYVTYDPSTKTISSTKEWEGGVLTMEADENVKNEQLVVTLAEKGNAYIVVNYKEDGVTATEKGIDNGTTTTLNLSDNYIKEIIIKATSGASAETPQTIKLASVVLQAKPVDNRTEHVLTSSAGTIGDWSGGPTFEAYQFANAEVGDRIVVTISELPDGDYHQIALQSNGSADKLGGTQNAVVGDYEVTLDADGLAELKANGLYVTGKYYTYSKIALWSENELGEEPKEDEISNTSATEAAKKVFSVLKDLYGKKIVSGVVANVDWNTKEAENVYGWTGKYPAMNVYDYINLHASKDVNSAGWVDYSDITTAKNWWKEGGIVGAMWHWQVKANNGTDYTCTPGTAAGETSFDASKVYVEGTPENTLAKQQLDQLCGYLKKMQDAGIPVVWRPLHEASGNVEQYSGGKAWFWWGAKGADVYKQLWQWMYNYMVKTKGLNNLIWVWTSQTKDNNWYPGDAYVDIIGRDNYGATAATLATEYETQKAAYPNKMITLSECGNSETTEMAKLSSIWDAGSRWSWFMTWYDGDYNKGASTTHKHAGETWWNDAVSKDYVITRDKMKELLGQESSDDSKTGVNISLDDLNEGWSSSYNAATKTITTEGEWAARGWYIGDNRYNSKGSVTVKFEAVNFGVTLKMEYTNTGGESKSVSAGAAAGETGVELDIPADIKTIDKVYITYQPIGTLKLTAATVNDKVVDNRTERTLVEKSQAISDGDIAINRGLFSNAVAGDEIRIYADGLSESSKLALEPGDYSGAFDGANWTGFTESPFKLKLTATLIATIKEKGLLIRGESFTFKKAVLYTEKELGSEISDEEKKGDEEKDDDETIIDKKTGEADLTVLSAQDDTKTTLTENEDGSITMTTTEPYCAAQIWFNDPEPVAGNVLKVELAESKVNVTITVQYTDGTQSQMSANTSGVATARAATRGDSDPGTTIEVPLETGKEVQNIEVKNNVAGTITIKKMQVTTINIFTNGVANLSMLKPQSNATYDTSTHTLATTKGWTGATISPVGGENVSGKELLIEFADASKVKVAVKYRTDVEGPSTIMEKAAKAVRLALDNTKNIQEISIQPTEASIVTFKKIAVNSEESDDGTLKPGKTITLWESAAGETLSWNEVAKQDASVGEMLQEYDELLITISGVTEGCDWPKVFIRDASSEQAGNEVLLNDVGSFPYTVRIVLTGEMAQQLQKGFSICGDGVTVTKLQVYRPEAPKTGDIHLADLNYGYNSSYDKGTHTITTTARWAARGWEIGDKRYNDKNLITVKFEPVDFPVTLKMEYTTGLQTAQATSVGVPAGRTELLLEIPSGISKLNRVYIIYENPGSVKLTEASVTYQDKLKLSTAIEAFEAEGVIRDGRYDTDGWYNLRGMRIAEPKTSGIYIHGGKKVVIY